MSVERVGVEHERHAFGDRPRDERLRRRRVPSPGAADDRACARAQDIAAARSISSG